MIFVFVLPDGNIVRIIFGIPMLLFIPGYALVSVLWPEKRTNLNEDIDENLERFALSFGLSIAIVSIIGLALNFTSAGINLMTTVFANFGIIFLLSLFAFYRRQQLPVERRYNIDLTFKTARMPEDKTERVFIVAITVVLILSGIVLAYVLVTPGVEDKYTVMYILDHNGTAVDYVSDITINETAEVIVGFESHQFETTLYSFYTGIISLDGIDNYVYWNSWNQTDDLTNVSGGGQAIQLEHGESYERNFEFNIRTSGTYQIIWQLHTEGTDNYYEVRIRVNINAA